MSKKTMASGAFLFWGMLYYYSGMEDAFPTGRIVK
jgi:hypothetical protein